MAELSNLVAMSYREYDKEFLKLEQTDAASLERLLALPDEELWETNGMEYPRTMDADGGSTDGGGTPYLGQPDLGYSETWMLEGHEGEKDERFRNLVTQAVRVAWRRSIRLLSCGRLSSLLLTCGPLTSALTICVSMVAASFAVML